jgi:probable HAF family extracellular repeat protein
MRRWWIGASPVISTVWSLRRNRLHLVPLDSIQKNSKGRAMQRHFLARTALAMGLLACGSEPVTAPVEAPQLLTIAAGYKRGDIGTLGGGLSEAFGGNNLGQVVGYSETANGERHAFVWQNGVMTDLGSIGGHTQATAINAAGQIVGYGITPAGWDQALLWKNGVPTPLPGLGGQRSQATAINAAGDIVGFATKKFGARRAVLWRNGT